MPVAYTHWHTSDANLMKSVAAARLRTRAKLSYKRKLKWWHGAEILPPAFGQVLSSTIFRKTRDLDSIAKLE